MAYALDYEVLSVYKNQVWMGKGRDTSIPAQEYRALEKGSNWRRRLMKTTRVK